MGKAQLNCPRCGAARVYAKHQGPKRLAFLASRPCRACALADLAARRAQEAMRGERKPACSRCGRTVATRPGGLCWSCYYTPGVREQYVQPKPASAVLLSAPVAGPGEPTDTRPGSEERLRVYERRVARGEPLFVPGDYSLRRAS